MGSSDGRGTDRQDGMENRANHSDSTDMAPNAETRKWPSPPYRLGRRTGIDVRAGKNIRRFSNGMENFSDFFDSSPPSVKEVRKLPSPQYHIGRRTGLDVRAGKTIRRLSNGMEHFSDFFDSSPSSTEVSDGSTEGSEVDPTRLKAINVRQGKSIRRLSNGMENFSDFLSDSSLESSPGEKNLSAVAMKSVASSKAGSLLERDGTVEVKRACTPALSTLIRGDLSGIVDTTPTEKTDILKCIDILGKNDRGVPHLDRSGSIPQGQYKRARISQPELLEERKFLSVHLTSLQLVTSLGSPCSSGVAPNSQVRQKLRLDCSNKNGLLFGTFGTSFEEALITTDLKSASLEHPQAAQDRNEQSDQLKCSRTGSSAEPNAEHAEITVPPSHNKYRHLLPTAHRMPDVVGDAHGASLVSLSSDSDNRMNMKSSSHASDEPAPIVQKRTSSQQGHLGLSLPQQSYRCKQWPRQDSKMTTSTTADPRFSRNQKALICSLPDAVVQDIQHNQPGKMTTRSSTQSRKALPKRFPDSRRNIEITATKGDWEEVAQRNKHGSCHESAACPEHEVHQRSLSCGNGRKRSVGAPSDDLEHRSTLSDADQIQVPLDKAGRSFIQSTHPVNKAEARATESSLNKKRRKPNEKRQKSAENVKLKKTVPHPKDRSSTELSPKKRRTTNKKRQESAKNVKLKETVPHSSDGSSTELSPKKRRTTNKKRQESAKNVKLKETVPHSSDGSNMELRRGTRTRQPPPPKYGLYTPVYDYRPDGPVFLRYDQLDPVNAPSKCGRVSSKPSSHAKVELAPTIQEKSSSPERCSKLSLLQRSYRHKHWPKRVTSPAGDPKSNRSRRVQNHLSRDAAVQDKQDNQPRQMATRLSTRPKKTSPKGFLVSGHSIRDTVSRGNCEETTQRNEHGNCHEIAASFEHELYQGSPSSGDGKERPVTPSEHLEHQIVWSDADQMQDRFDKASKTFMQSTDIMNKAEGRATESSPKRKRQNLKQNRERKKSTKKMKLKESVPHPSDVRGVPGTASPGPPQSKSTEVELPILSPEYRSTLRDAILKKACELKFLDSTDLFKGNTRNTYKVATYLLMESCHIGIVRIRPGNAKQTSVLLHHSMILLAMNYPVTITIHGKTWSVLHKNDLVIVPHGVRYSIYNISQENTAELLFVVFG